jgi:hypothetical protein
MLRRLWTAVLAPALLASVFRPVEGAVPLDVIVRSGQATPMDDGVFSDDFAANFSFDIAPSTQTLVLRALLENSIIDPYDPSVWLGDPRPNLLLARFDRRAGEIPEEVRYADFTSPFFVNDNGQSAFRVLLSGVDVTTDNDAALYVTNASGAHFAIREGDPAPDTSATFREFVIGGLDNQGRTALRAGLQPSTEGAGIFRATYIGQSELIARTGGAAPGTQSTFANFFGVPLYSATGQIAFEATLANVAANTQSGVWGGSPENLFKIARQGDQATASGLFFHNFQWTDLRENQIAFLAELRATPDGPGAVASAIFAGPISAFDVLRTTGDQAPGMPAGVVFSSFGLPNVNSNGRVVFDALLSGPGIAGGNDLSVWIGDASSFTFVAQEGMQAPGTETATFARFDRMWINDLGQATFLADLASGAGASRGLFSYDPLGGLSLIARTGDEITLGFGDTATIHGFEGQPQLNDLGEVIFQVDLSTGVVGPEAVLRATIPVPEPGIWGFAVSAVVSVWLYTFRRNNSLT